MDITTLAESVSCWLVCAPLLSRSRRFRLSESLCEGVDKELEALGIQIRQFQEEPIARRRLDGAIDIEPLEDVLDYPDGLHPTRRQTAADR
jgi:hypothetical protein